jgi:hypothetical protein
MQSLRDTWGFWYKNHTLGETKTLEQGIISFFNLFTDAQKQYLITESKYSDFVKVISKKSNEPFGTDSAEDKKEAERYIKEYNDLRDKRRQGA